MKKVDLIRDYYAIKSEKDNNEQKVNEPLIVKLNKIIDKLKVNDNTLKYFDDEMLRFIYEDKSSFEKYKYCLDILKKYDKFVIGENRYVYYDRDLVWERFNYEKTFITYDDIILLYHYVLSNDNAIIIEFQEFFNNGKLIKPEQFETKEERQAYKEKLDNALKTYY